MIKDKFFEYNAIVLAFTLIGGALNYLYQVILARILTPAEFGTIGAMVSIFYIISIISGTVSKSITNFVAGASKEEIAGLFRYSFTRLSILSILFTLAFIFSIPVLARYLKIKELELFYVISGILMLSFIMPIFQGIFLGLKKFKENCSVGLVSVIIKFVGVYLAFKMRMLGALLGFLVSSLSMLFLSILILRDYIFTTYFNNNYKIFTYSIPVFIASVFSILPTNLDLIIVKGLFTSHDAGIYTSLTVLAKILLFIASPVTIVLFPLVSERHNRGETSMDILLKSIVYTIILSGGVAVLYFFYPQIVIKVFGENYGEAISYLSKYGIGMLCFVISLVFLYYYLAIRKYTYILFFSFIITFYISLINLAGDLSEVTEIFLYGNSFLLLFSIIYFVFREFFASLILRKR